MNSLVRAVFVSSHLVVLGLGLAVGFQSRPDRRMAAERDAARPNGPETARTVPLSTGGTVSEVAAAWESLKDRYLPRSERLGIQAALLREWSLDDPEAAIHAALGESPSQQDELLRACGPGVLAHPSMLWERIMFRAFGWETARVRSLWIGLMADNQPVKLFPKLRDMPESVRLDALQHLAIIWRDIEDAAVRAEVFEGLQRHAAAGDREAFDLIACSLAEGIPLEYLLPELLRADTPSGRRLAATGIGIALVSYEDDEFEAEFARVPESLRAEVASAALFADAWGNEITFEFARIALDAGDLDALKAAGENDSFGRFADNTEHPAELADWALTLPEDPRTLELYRTAIGGAAVKDFAAVRGKILALPPGWRRDHGLAALAYGGHYSDQPAGEIGQLLQRIQNPEVQARARKEYDARRKADDE